MSRTSTRRRAKTCGRRLLVHPGAAVDVVDERRLRASTSRALGAAAAGEAHEHALAGHQVARTGQLEHDIDGGRRRDSPSAAPRHAARGGQARPSPRPRRRTSAPRCEIDRRGDRRRRRAPDPQAVESARSAASGAEAATAWPGAALTLSTTPSLGAETTSSFAWLIGLRLTTRQPFLRGLQAASAIPELRARFFDRAAAARSVLRGAVRPARLSCAPRRPSRRPPRHRAPR